MMAISMEKKRGDAAALSLQVTILKMIMIVNSRRIPTLLPSLLSVEMIELSRY